MSVIRARGLLLNRLGDTTTMLLAEILDLPTVPSWADGRTADDRAGLLVNAHTLRGLPEGEAAIAAVLAGLAEGHLLPGVRPVAYERKASEALDTLWVGEGVEEELVDGPRATGKTQLTAGGIAGMAELHARAGYPLPFIVLWLHSSLTNAKAKTIPSLQQAHWAGLWTFKDDNQTAVLTVGGIEMAHCHFVGTGDATSSERARAEAHMVCADEVIPSMDDSGGVSERLFDLAKNSARLPTRRRMALAVTNPGDPETWPYRRFIEGGGRTGCVRRAVPASDRLTAAQVQQQIDDFADSPDLAARLGRGEWVGLELGPLVAKGFSLDTHVAKAPLAIPRYTELWLGWDSAPNAHTHAVVIGQRAGGEVRVFACLVGENTGLKQLLEAVVVPWFGRMAPWALEPGGRERLHHRYDPAMDTEEGGDAEQNPVMRLRRSIGGTFRPGAVAWAARSGPMLALLNQGNGRGGMAVQIDPREDTAVLRKALSGRWHYAVTRGGVVIHDLPAKPNHPWEDAGDAFCYFVGGLAPVGREGSGRRPEVITGFNKITGKPNAAPTSRGGWHRIPWEP